jgi:5-hydroxyisourate hydrolase
MAGKLSTHVLDIHHGCPAAGVAIQLWECGADRAPKLLKSVVTNADGRPGDPLLAGDDFHAGTFELRFQVGAYFKKMQTRLPEPSFLGEVPVRFTVADAAAAYHVPLVVSPWAYSTYRGS